MKKKWKLELLYNGKKKTSKSNDQQVAYAQRKNTPKFKIEIK